MSNQPRVSSETITQPMLLVVDNTAVENVYALPGTSPEVADMASLEAFTKYAASRFEPRFQGSDEMVIEVPVEVPRHRIVREKGWVLDFTPRLSAAVLLGTTIVANFFGNFGSLKADAQELLEQRLFDAKQNVREFLGHEQKTTTITADTATPGGIITLHGEHTQPVGKSAPSVEGTKDLIDQIAAAKQNGSTINRITVSAESSDERGPHESTLQVPDAGNDALDTARATDAAKELEKQAEAAGIDLPQIEITSAEHLLNAEEVAQLKEAAAKHGLSLDKAMEIFNDGGELADELQTLLQAKLGDARVVSISIEMQEPTQITTDTLMRGEQPPKDEEHPYTFFPGLTYPFMRRRRLVKYMKPSTKEVVLPATKPDERWIELYPEAVQADGTLRRDAWRFSRKYQLLGREDRIPYTLTHRYKDAGGVDQEMQVLFIDHEPTDDAIQMYKEILSDTSQMNDGKVAEQWSAFSVYPRSQVGLNPTGGRRGQTPAHDPADIGLDIDQQASKGILGLAIPAMGLIEMHMPEFNIDVDALKPRDGQTIEEAYQEAYDQARREYMQALRGYMKANWVAAHELPGHGTDVDNTPIHLIQAHPQNFTHFYTSSNWHDTAATQYEQLPDSDAEGTRDFDVTWQVATPSGETVTLDEKVYQEGASRIGFFKRLAMRMMRLDPEAHIQAAVDPRLRASQHAILNRRKPTKYSGEDSLELYAETAAQEVTGEQIPYDQAGVQVAPYHHELGQGYAVDPGLKQMFEQHTGWSRETSRPVNEDEFTLSLAADNPVIGAWMDQARNTPMPNDRITLLARVTSIKDPLAQAEQTK